MSPASFERTRSIHYVAEDDSPGCIDEEDDPLLPQESRDNSPVDDYRSVVLLLGEWRIPGIVRGTPVVVERIRLSRDVRDTTRDSGL